MATRVGGDKIRLALFDSPITTLNGSKNVNKIKSFCYYVFWDIICKVFCTELNIL